MYFINEKMPEDKFSPGIRMLYNNFYFGIIFLRNSPYSTQSLIGL